MSDTQEKIRAVLAALPGLERRLVSARLRDGIATIVVEASGLDAGERAGIERQVRAALVAVPGIIDSRVALTLEKPVRQVVAIASGKGGVGKSTVAANLAVALARAGRRIGLVDADIYGPSQPRLLGQPNRPEMIDEQIVPLPAHGLRMLSIGQLIAPGTAVAWRGPMTASALTSLMDAGWGDCEMLIVDLPPGTGDVQMTLTQKWKPAGAVIVSTPQDLALIDATRAIDMFRKMDVPILGLIENMAGYACPHCGEISDPFGSGGAEAAAAVMAIPFLGRIPLKASIRTASDSGQPPAAGEGEEAELFAALARRLLERLDGDPGRASPV